LLLEVLFLLVRQKLVSFLFVAVFWTKFDSDWEENRRKETSGSNFAIIYNDKIRELKTVSV